MSSRRRKRHIHVVPSGRGFIARRARGRRLFTTPVSQQDAIERAIPVAKRLRCEVIIHRANGQIRDADSYGPDSSEHRDNKH